MCAGFNKATYFLRMQKMRLAGGRGQLCLLVTFSGPIRPVKRRKLIAIALLYKSPFLRRLHYVYGRIQTR
jgi:hypothetical protein